MSSWHFDHHPVDPNPLAPHLVAIVRGLRIVYLAIGDDQYAVPGRTLATGPDIVAWHRERRHHVTGDPT